MDSALGEHVADVGSLVEMIGKKDQRRIFQFRQIYSFPLGQGMVLADEQASDSFSGAADNDWVLLAAGW